MVHKLSCDAFNLIGSFHFCEWFRWSSKKKIRLSHHERRSRHRKFIIWKCIHWICITLWKMVEHSQKATICKTKRLYNEIINYRSFSKENSSNASQTESEIVGSNFCVNDPFVSSSILWKPSSHWSLEQQFFINGLQPVMSWHEIFECKYMLGRKQCCQFSVGLLCN